MERSFGVKTELVQLVQVMLSSKIIQLATDALALGEEFISHEQRLRIKYFKVFALLAYNNKRSFWLAVKEVDEMKLILNHYDSCASEEQRREYYAIFAQIKSQQYYQIPINDQSSELVQQLHADGWNLITKGKFKEATVWFECKIRALQKELYANSEITAEVVPPNLKLVFADLQHGLARALSSLGFSSQVCCYFMLLVSPNSAIDCRLQISFHSQDTII